MNVSAPSARLGAAELLFRVLERGQSLDGALEDSRAYSVLRGPDRAFARAIATAALRRLGGVDAVLDRFLERPLPEEAGSARAVLRVGAAELLVLGSAPHAAVSEAVEAAQQAAPRFAGLTNAVLRRVAQERSAFDSLPPGSDLPEWLFTRWRAAYGDTDAGAMAAAIREQPPIDLTAKADAEGWAARLGATLTPTGSIRLPMEHAPISRLEGYDDGAWWVQDAAAALPARLLGDVAGRRVLDLCAAPGGKTLQLAAMGADVTALDVDQARLARVGENLERTGLAAQIVAADALDWRPAEPFDAVLLDAPCTATGTLRRRPDAAWLRRPGDIASLSALQGKLLAAAAGFLRPGGRLVYAVCSLEPEEGDGVAAQAQRYGLIEDPIGVDEIPGLDGLLRDGRLRTLPSHWGPIGGLDGFFATRFTRT